MDKTSQTNEIVKLYVKIFLFCAIFWGLWTGLFFGIFSLIRTLATSIFLWVDTGSLPPSYLIRSFLLPPGLGLLSGMLFGVFMSLITGTMHVAAVRQLPYGKRPGALQVHQSRSIELKLPYDKVFNLCLEAILVRGGTIYQKSHEQGTIIAKTSGNLKTWGTSISLNLDRLDGGTTRIMISGKPVLRTTLVDMGSNLETVNNIAAFLKLKEEQASTM